MFLKSILLLILTLTISNTSFSKSKRKKVVTTIDGYRPNLRFDKYRESWNDGDTLVTTINKEKTRYRLVGFNTLESYGPVHCFGKWSAEELYWFNNDVATKTARGRHPEISWERDCKTDGKKDAYGRQLLFCGDLGKTLVANGLAHVYDYNPNKRKPAWKAKYYNTLKRVQGKALKKNLGLWKKGPPSGWIVTSLHSSDEVQRVLSLVPKHKTVLISPIGPDQYEVNGYKAPKKIDFKKGKTLKKLLQEIKPLGLKNKKGSYLKKSMNSYPSNNLSFYFNYYLLLPGESVNFDRRYKRFVKLKITNKSDSKFEFIRDLNNNLNVIHKGKTLSLSVKILSSTNQFKAALSSQFAQKLSILSPKKQKYKLDGFWEAPFNDAIASKTTALHLIKKYSKNRVINMATGASRTIKHRQSMNLCEWWCFRDKGKTQSCMMYIPYKYRYGKKKAWCIRASKKKKPRFFCSKIMDGGKSFIKFFKFQ